MEAIEETGQTEQKVEEPTNQRMSVTLSGYEWHRLLQEMEFTASISNRDRTMIKSLYEKIGSQLHGASVTLSFPEPKSEPEPPKRKGWLS